MSNKKIDNFNRLVKKIIELGEDNCKNNIGIDYEKLELSFCFENNLYCIKFLEEDENLKIKIFIYCYLREKWIEVEDFDFIATIEGILISKRIIKDKKYE